ncbi:MAG: DUF1015 domain-containing protein [Candidatus Melainabacteria bacterium]
MVQLLPFRGLRYNPAKVSSLQAVVAPPYDVINEAMQAQLYAADPANIVRLDLGKKTDDDSVHENVYTRAAQTLRSWQKDSVVLPEARPAVYAYSQQWRDDDGEHDRKGMVALIKLEEFESGQVLPHEFTLKGPKLDRMNLSKATMANLSQIFMIYADPKRVMEGVLFPPGTYEADEWQQVTAHDGVSHRFRPVTDEAAIAKLQDLMATQTLLIADGHHRYETALAFKQEVRDALRQKTGSVPPDGALLSDYLMVFMANLHDPGLQVFPTDRVIYDWPAGWTQERFESALFSTFQEVTEGEDFSYQTPGKPPVKLKLTDAGKLNALPTEKLKQFDCAVLEEAVFKGIFALPGEALKADHKLGFYRDPAAVSAMLEKKDIQAVFWMDTPPLELIRDICLSGHRMPQKSTYFFPKILTGLVLYSYQSFPAGGHGLSETQGVEAQPVDTVLFDAFNPQLALVPD